MARYKGYDGALTVDSNALGECESFELEDTVDEYDANVLGVLGWTDVEPGRRTITGTITVLRDPDDVGQAAIPVPGSVVTMSLFPEGNTSSRTEISGDFMISTVGVNVPVDNLVKNTYTFRNKGIITFSTVA